MEEQQSKIAYLIQYTSGEEVLDSVILGTDWADAARLLDAKVSGAEITRIKNLGWTVLIPPKNKDLNWYLVETESSVSDTERIFLVMSATISEACIITEEELEDITPRYVKGADTLETGIIF